MLSERAQNESARGANLQEAKSNGHIQPLRVLKRSREGKTGCSTSRTPCGLNGADIVDGFPYDEDEQLQDETEGAQQLKLEAHGVRDS
jgi:hypothetical protein